MKVARRTSIANHHPRLSLPRRAVQCAIHTLDQAAGRFNGGCPAGELSLVFLSDVALAKIHADFLHDPTPTDVITFAGDGSLGVAGEICVSVDRAAAYAAGHCHDFSTELTLYVVHGWLHLAGYDDIQPAKKRRMRAAEARALALLQAAAALPTFVLRK
ncbi:MAG: rRNA maturation RNase YbeY [Cephaloticoccus sp.]|nr:rRNA maturation RNase YbeY [Cephaloticoccus sp.]MCF7761774.1 rRNA maturation RNase YbeY [Cephaloticoccus sp.]